jgi:hypothetical protein
MNSLPFISHHLFVAAIRHEGRRQETPVRRDTPFANMAEQMDAVPLEVVDTRESMLEAAAHASRARIVQARA